MDKEIREAVKVFKFARSLMGANKVLYNLAQQYLSIEGFSKEEPMHHLWSKPRKGFCLECERIERRNNIIKDCKLAVMKMYSVERIKKEIDNFIYPNTKELAQAIHNLGEKE